MRVLYYETSSVDPWHNLSIEEYLSEQIGKGEVLLYGIDGHEVSINADLRKLFSYVPQGNTVLSGTIAENMRMVKEEASDEEIVDALKHLDLPSGVDIQIKY